MLDAQYDQAPVVLDTSWLLVGHTDETTHVIPANTPRGWTMMVADPRLAVRQLRAAGDAGHGSARLFQGTSETTKPTIDNALADRKFTEANEAAARHIDAQVDVLTRETGVRADELVRVPVLFQQLDANAMSGAEVKEQVDSRRMTQPDVDRLAARMRSGSAPPAVLIAHTASIPNGLSLTPGVLAAPDPHGPAVGGVDLFKKATLDALKSSPVIVRWGKDWDYLHKLEGEVHCGTNALRSPTRADRWNATPAA
ncbi:protein-arginine deiminase family protein [Longispora urticae]